jgi:hypothetical protein
MSPVKPRVNVRIDQSEYDTQWQGYRYRKDEDELFRMIRILAGKSLKVLLRKVTEFNEDK